MILASMQALAYKPLANKLVSPTMQVDLNKKGVHLLVGATVAERLARSPPTKAIWVQSPAGSPDLRKWESCRTMPFSQRAFSGPPKSLRSPSSAMDCPDSPDAFLDFCALFSRCGFTLLRHRTAKVTWPAFKRVTSSGVVLTHDALRVQRKMPHSTTRGEEREGGREGARPTSQRPRRNRVSRRAGRAIALRGGGGAEDIRTSVVQAYLAGNGAPLAAATRQPCVDTLATHSGPEISSTPALPVCRRSSRYGSRQPRVPAPLSPFQPPETTRSYKRSLNIRTAEKIPIPSYNALFTKHRAQEESRLERSVGARQHHLPLPGPTTNNPPLLPSSSLLHPDEQTRCTYGLRTTSSLLTRRLLTSPPHMRTQMTPPAYGEPGSITRGVAPGFSHEGIATDDAAGRRIFSGISLFPLLCIPSLLHAHRASPSSALKTSIVTRAASNFPGQGQQGINIVRRVSGPAVVELMSGRVSATDDELRERWPAKGKSATASIKHLSTATYAHYGRVLKLICKFDWKPSTVWAETDNHVSTSDNAFLVLEICYADGSRQVREIVFAGDYDCVALLLNTLHIRGSATVSGRAQVGVSSTSSENTAASRLFTINDEAHDNVNFTPCIQVDPKQGFQKCSLYHEQPIDCELQPQQVDEMAVLTSDTSECRCQLETVRNAQWLISYRLDQQPRAANQRMSTPTSKEPPRHCTSVYLAILASEKAKVIVNGLYIDLRRVDVRPFGPREKAVCLIGRVSGIRVPERVEVGAFSYVRNVLYWFRSEFWLSFANHGRINSPGKT
ncbi:hypothetical protein PR048_004461 [Dryococelus australis]|uniref:Uncharacterized protein n=1 Tax=Dryococelus australis TaxID=614101 RepID=A0ABQ9I5J9_9NEOP|nr:hypothetical protein PR048_004461 [Dryococelus australis]